MLQFADVGRAGDGFGGDGDGFDAVVSSNNVVGSIVYDGASAGSVLLRQPGAGELGNITIPGFEKKLLQSMQLDRQSMI